MACARHRNRDRLTLGDAPAGIEPATPGLGSLPGGLLEACADLAQSPLAKCHPLVVLPGDALAAFDPVWNLCALDFARHELAQAPVVRHVLGVLTQRAPGLPRRPRIEQPLEVAIHQPDEPIIPSACFLPELQERLPVLDPGKAGVKLDRRRRSWAFGLRGRAVSVPGWTESEPRADGDQNEGCYKGATSEPRHTPVVPSDPDSTSARICRHSSSRPYRWGRGTRVLERRGP
jgi:hypothetical protein